MTGYALSIATGGKISMSTVYRWVRARGRVRTIDTQLLARCVRRSTWGRPMSSN